MDLSIIHNATIAILALVPGTIWIYKACREEYINSGKVFNIANFKISWPTFFLVESLYVLIVLKVFLLTTPVLQ